MENDIKDIKKMVSYLVDQHSEDTKIMKRDLKSLVNQHSAGIPSHPDRVLQFVQQSASTSAGRSENPDIFSDTASTASTGSEDDYAIRTRCLSDALESHFLEIVQNIPYEAIADRVVEQQVVTLKENERIRGLASDDDKLRSLVVVSMNKSYDTMLRFLDLIGKCMKSLKEVILNTFEDRYSGQPKHIVLKCIWCLIKKRADIKDACDHLLTRHLISRDLHLDVTQNQTSKNSEMLWQRVFAELSKEHSEYILKVFKDILSDGEGEDISHFDDIIRKIDRDIAKHRRFQCRCQKNKKRHLSPLPPSDMPPKFKLPKSNPDFEHLG